MTEDIRSIAMKLAGVDSIHPGQRPSPARALAEFLGCSISNAWGLLNGSRKPNPQMEKMINELIQSGKRNHLSVNGDKNHVKKRCEVGKINLKT